MRLGKEFEKQSWPIEGLVAAIRLPLLENLGDLGTGKTGLLDLVYSLVHSDPRPKFHESLFDLLVLEFILVYQDPNELLQDAIIPRFL